jgi:hypothetical protein
MALSTMLLSLVALALASVAHDHHSHDDQMPAGYVKYPYQAQFRYPHDDGLTVSG